MNFMFANIISCKNFTRTFSALEEKKENSGRVRRSQILNARWYPNKNCGTLLILHFVKYTLNLLANNFINQYVNYCEQLQYYILYT